MAVAVGSPGQKVKATFVGDSVAASLSYTRAAQSQLQKGVAVKLT